MEQETLVENVSERSDLVENASERSDLLQNDSQPPRKINGWLAFFLWVGVGFGAFMSCVITILAISKIGVTPVSALIYCGYLGALVVTAVMTIVAFYKRKENAVSLAFVYIAIIAIDGLAQIALSAFGNISLEIKNVVRPFLWALIWFLYLMLSKQVKEVIPVEIRKTKPVEIILLVVYVVSCIVLHVELDKMVKDPKSSLLVSNEYLIKQTIAEMNTEFPTMSDGIRIEKVTLEGKTVMYNYQFPNVGLDDLDAGYISKHCIYHKQEVLEGYATETDEDIIGITDLFFGSGYDVCYHFKDRKDMTVYDIVVTPSEYEWAKEQADTFRCEKAAWEELLTEVNSELPIEYLGDCFLNNVTVDFENNALIYTVALPEMKSYILKLFITESYFKNFIIENAEGLSNYLWSMAGIDKMDLKYQLVTSEGEDHVQVVVPYEEYKEYL